MKNLLKNLRIVKNFKNSFRTRKLLKNSAGQINLDSESGKFLNELIQEYEIFSILDIGTWNGLGSTLTAYNALVLKNKDSKITSIESDKIAYRLAVKNLSKYPEIILKYGRLIEISDLVKPEEIDFLSHNLYPENIEWYIQDLRRYERTENLFLELDLEYDLIIFDGGEFSTFPEFIKLYERTKFFCLDDIFTYKQFDVLNFIKRNSSKFELIKTVNGFSFYKTNC